MKNNKYVRILGLFLSVSVAAAVASEKVSVQASSDLRVTLIDTTNSSKERALVQSALGTSLSVGMTRECKAPVQVKIKVADAGRAAKELKAGSCDAVVVIGNSVPAVLMKNGASVLKATDARSGDLNRTFYLVANTSDPAMNQIVGVAFDHAIKSDTLQNALAGKTGTASNLAATAR
jgi:ABC-type tungstate transport system permease subunit